MEDVSEVGRRDGEATVLGFQWAPDAIIESGECPNILERKLCKGPNGLKILSAELCGNVFKHATVCFIALEDAQVVAIADFFYVVCIGIVHSLQRRNRDKRRRLRKTKRFNQFSVFE